MLGQQVICQAAGHCGFTECTIGQQRLHKELAVATQGGFYRQSLAFDLRFQQLCQIIRKVEHLHRPEAAGCGGSR